METRRFILYAILAFILYSMWTKWQLEYATQGNVPGQTLHASENSFNATSGANALLPNVVDEKTIENQNNLKTASDQQVSSPLDHDVTETALRNRLIHVTTDQMALDIDSTFGDIVKVALLDYPIDINDKAPFLLLTDESGHQYTANSSLLEKTTGGVNSIQFHFHTDADHYQFYDKQDNLNVVLSGQTDNNVLVKKIFHFTKGSYLIHVTYEVNNQSTDTWLGYFNTQLLRSAPEEDKSSMFHIGSYTGASYSNPTAQRYKKVSFADMSKGNLNLSVNGGWIAMQQHYFLSAWVPSAETKNTFYTRTANEDYTIGFVSQPLIVNPGETKTYGAQLYIGPEVTSTLKEISPGLDLTIDYGWLWFLSSFLFTIMKTIYAGVGNWGWTIVLVTVLVKLAFYRLSATSYRSMAGMRQLQPKLQALRERCGDDKAKLSQATMELYRQEKINPLGGCLPIIVQIPVFIALYWVLLESVELRQAPFILWIHDLSMSDPYHVLPVIMGATMLIQQRLNPAPPDPMQAKIMMFLPVLFTGLFWNFPAGLVLYWIVNNSLSILQQWYITQKFSDNKNHSKALKLPKKAANK